MEKTGLDDKVKKDWLQLFPMYGAYRLHKANLSGQPTILDDQIYLRKEIKTQLYLLYQAYAIVIPPALAVHEFVKRLY